MGSLYRPVKIANLSLTGNLFLAPTAGFSDKAFRSICTELGADFTYTEMVSSEALVRNSEKTEKLAERAFNESRFAVQIFGSDAEVMSKAAEIVFLKYNPECIDINAGCPMAKITKNGAGSALMLNVKNFCNVVSSVVKVSEKYGKPVSVKIRSGWSASNLNWKEIAYAAADCGVKALTLHPRTREQCYAGKADKEILSSAVQLLKPYDIPVFASGDIFTPEDAANVLKNTGCAAVMFARGSLGNPFIFKQTKDLLSTGSYCTISAETKMQTGIKELLLLCSEKGEIKGCIEMRKRFTAYTKGLKDAQELRKNLVKAASIEEYKDIIFSYLHRLG